jgi:WD40 repeat protein
VHPECTTSKDGRGTVWNVESGVNQGSVMIPTVASTIDWSPHGVHELAIGCDDGAIFLW